MNSETLGLAGTAEIVYQRYYRNDANDGMPLRLSPMGAGVRRIWHKPAPGEKHNFVAFQSVIVMSGSAANVLALSGQLSVWRSVRPGRRIEPRCPRFWARASRATLVAAVKAVLVKFDGGTKCGSPPL